MEKDGDRYEEGDLRDISSTQPSHGGDVDHARGCLGTSALEEEGFEELSGVEDGFDVQGEEFVPAMFGEVIVGSAPVGRRVSVSIART